MDGTPSRKFGPFTGIVAVGSGGGCDDCECGTAAPLWLELAIAFTVIVGRGITDT